ncbi:MAG: glycosyltransferase family 39 protein [Nitrospirae bacterium]|nr:glycosyltransferase family 39 protein [Nitrospirota bacterium]
MKNIKISPDSIRYGLISQQILYGNGIRIPLIEFDNLVPVNGTVPFLVQPPLLPVLLAMLGGVTSKSYLAAQILNVICHVAIALFTFLLMKRLCNRHIALLTGILVSISLPILYVTNHIMGEPLFISFTAGTIYFLIASRDNNDHHCCRLILAGICASAAILTRYAGIALLAVFFWEAFIMIRNKKFRDHYVRFLAGITIPLMTIVLLFTRNHIISGTIEGIYLPKPERTFTDSFIGTIKMIFQQFQLGNLSIILISISITVFAAIILINANIRKEFPRHLKNGIDLIAVFIASYTILISFTLANQQPQLELRYVAPLVPFLFIISIFLIVFTFESANRKISSAGMLLLLSIITLHCSYKTYINLPEFFYKNEKISAILDSCTYKWIKESYRNDVIIATNEPYRLGFFGGYSTVVLPHRKWILNNPIPDDMERALPKRMSQAGAQVLALFNFDEVKEEHYGSYISGLFSKRDDMPPFFLTYKCPDGVVYRLKN